MCNSHCGEWAAGRTMGGVTSAPASPVPSSPSVLGLAPVIPVVVLHDADDAVPLARALVAGGLPAIEVTLRTPAALTAIRAVSEEVPEAVIGAGTLLTPDRSKPPSW